MLIFTKCKELNSSSLQSLQRGKLTEIDFLNEYIAKNALLYGVSAPVNDFMVKMIHQIEKKERKVTFANFEYPFFDRIN
jgi:2-dehydropantoate 2-reductase